MRLSLRWTVAGLAATGMVPGVVAAEASVEAPAFVNDFRYDRGAYGHQPLQVFRSTELTAPMFNFVKSSRSCDKSLYTLMTPRGGATEQAKAAIYNSQGQLIWAAPWHGQQLYNLMVQTYKGEKYLTFWAGNDAVGGHGAGFYYMLDKHYNLYKNITAANGLDGDLHDFRITKNGTAMLVVYAIVDKDLSALGKGVGPVWDCLIQEIDLETGESVFEWRATDHLAITDTYREIGGEGEGTTAFDWFHMNSIEKDHLGNYLISARYTHSLTYIDGRSGEVLWIMGGKRNMFRNVSNDLPLESSIDFAYQHDARWQDNGKVITLFDNGNDNAHTDRAATRGLRLRVDQQAMTVQVEREFVNPHHITSVSQGSMQTLPNGNVLLGYGNTPAFTEFAPDGTPLCDVHFAPERRFGSGDVQSYRVYKAAWQGWPASKPDAVVAQDSDEAADGDGQLRLWVSWNGATEVASWELQGAGRLDAKDDADWRRLDAADKTSFETGFPLKVTYPRCVRVVALDKKGKVLGRSDPLELRPEEAESGSDVSFTNAKVVVSRDLSGIHFLLLIGGVIVLSMVWRLARRSQIRSVHFFQKGVLV